MIINPRQTGNALIMSGYVILLYLNPLLGVVLKIIGAGCLLKHFYNLNQVDMVFTIGFFFIIDFIYLTKLIY